MAIQDHCPSTTQEAIGAQEAISTQKTINTQEVISAQEAISTQKAISIQEVISAQEVISTVDRSWAVVVWLARPSHLNAQGVKGKGRSS